jgi:hypothetical protein
LIQRLDILYSVATNEQRIIRTDFFCKLKVLFSMIQNMVTVIKMNVHMCNNIDPVLAMYVSKLFNSLT